ncbi:MAG TPA: hypothetical protein VMT18_12165 [Planctomycetota bacterium]|nr:hypothetical protein [Planctomycetota bacterium]
MVDRHGRPYFLWDNDLTLEQFVEQLRTGDDGVRSYLIAKLMRQAKPDDVFSFVRLDEIVGLWPGIRTRLGRTRAMWTWLLEEWGVIERG